MSLCCSHWSTLCKGCCAEYSTMIYSISLNMRGKVIFRDLEDHKIIEYWNKYWKQIITAKKCAVYDNVFSVSYLGQGGYDFTFLNKQNYQIDFHNAWTNINLISFQLRHFLEHCETGIVFFFKFATVFQGLKNRQFSCMVSEWEQKKTIGPWWSREL